MRARDLINGAVVAIGIMKSAAPFIFGGVSRDPLDDYHQQLCMQNYRIGV